jgi:hypothetical protein
LGTGELRIDKPLPPKKDTPPPAAVAAKPAEKKPAAKPEPAPKQLSRLEQLRLEKQQEEGGE